MRIVTRESSPYQTSECICSNSISVAIYNFMQGLITEVSKLHLPEPRNSSPRAI